MNNTSRNIKLTIEYDGTNYCGWQRQKNSRAIQEVLEESLSKVFKHDVAVIGAGRTDAGVHAEGQSANFLTDSKIPVKKVPLAINALLPKDIVVKEAVEVSTDFHARYSAKGKYYKYIINSSKFPSALNFNREYFCPYKLDMEVMKQALDLIIGTHDFKGFMSSGSSVKSTMRTINEALLEANDNQIIVNLKADGFLYNMVRIIIGTLIDASRGKISLDCVKEALETGNRKLAGKTIPPQGLYLVEVYY